MHKMFLLHVNRMFGSGKDGFTISDDNPDPPTSIGNWAQGANMPFPRYYGGSVMYTRNDTSWLYVLGGDTTGGGVPTATCLKYNLVTDTWEYIASLPEPLRTNASAILEDRIYTMGGFNAPFPSPAVASFYEYDINTNTWTQLPDLPDPLFFAGAEGFEDSLIYIIGGIQDNVITDDLWRHHVVLYNTNTMCIQRSNTNAGRHSIVWSLTCWQFFICSGRVKKYNRELELYS